MADYQLTETDAVVIRTIDSAFIPNDPANRDWVEYQAWLEEGGVPDPYVPPPEPQPPPPDDALLEAQRANKRLDDGITAAQTSVKGTTRAAPPKELPPYVDWVTFDALQAQVDTIQTAVKAMLEAQSGPQQLPP